MVDLRRIILDLDRRGLLIVLSLLAVLWIQAPRLGDEFRVEEDFRSFYWLNKIQDSELLPNDQMRGDTYISLRLPWGDFPLRFTSLGYWLLFHLAGFFVSPVTFSKLLAFLVMPITVFCFFEYGKSVRDRDVGTALGASFLFLNIASPTSVSVIPGLQRSFACSLIIALLPCLHRSKHVAAAIVVVVSALVYPPMFLLASATWALFALKPGWNYKPRQTLIENGIKQLVVAFFLGVLVLSPVVLPMFGEALGFVQTNDQAEPAPVNSPRSPWQKPEYQVGGRVPLFAGLPLGTGGLITKPLSALHVLILAGLSCCIYGIRGSDALKLPREAWSLLCAGLGLFALDWVTFASTGTFLLYMPSRYSQIALLLFFLIFVIINFREAMEKATQLVRSNRKKVGWLVGGIEILLISFVLLYPSEEAIYMGINTKLFLLPASLLLGILTIANLRNSPAPSYHAPKLQESSVGRLFVSLVIVIGVIAWGAHARVVSETSFLNPTASERELSKFVETLPKDTLLAGSPCILDDILLFSKRQILFGCELMPDDAQLTRDALDAYYAEEGQSLFGFCQTYEVDYIVIDQRTYTKEYLSRGWIFFEPYNQELLPRIRARDNFALANVPDDAKVFESGPFFVVPCTRSALAEK